MSVIVSRALPDVRDGLKPVHRRILYSMHESGFEWNRPYRKSARVVGEVMGKYHPHGDQAIYDSMVRMAQDFSLRLPLIDGQGNFGSMDGDRAAAMRYTEARLAYSAHLMLDDIDRDTVDFRSNYDDSEQEPEVLPSRIPNLLVNGAGGIAVGMATNLPPHNLREVIDACCAYVDNPAVTVEDLLEYVQGPDFPTGGLILGTAGARSGLLTGRGSVIIRARTSIEEVRKDREAIIVSEIPYQVNKSAMIEKIADGVRDKKIEGVSDIRDESDRDGVRVVIELKRDAIGDIVLNQLYRHSQLQTSFGINMLGLNGGRPELHNLRDLVAAFVDFREEVITRRIRYELDKARARARVLVGLVIAVSNIDEVVALIRKSKNANAAREDLMALAWPAADIAPLVSLINEPGQEVVDGVYRLSEVQAKAILDLRLNRLTALGRDELSDELRELGTKITEYLNILRHRDILMKILRDELIEIAERFGTDRRTEIIVSEFTREDEDLIQREDMIVSVSQTGYIKRVPVSTYRAQRRGGRGRTGMSTREEDVVSQLFVANTHTPVLFFTSDGKAYKMKVWKLPLGSPQSRGKAMVNLLPIATGETVNTVLPLPEDEGSWGELHVMFATSKGTVRRNDLSDFSNVKANGKLAMRLEEGDRLIGVAICQPEQEVFLAAAGGKCIRFPANAVRVFKSRTSEGVRGIKLAKGDTVISMSIFNGSVADTAERDAYVRFASARRQGRDEGAQRFGLTTERAEEMAANEQFVLTMTVNGFGKRTSSYEYRTAGRGGQGIINIETSNRNGNVIATFPIDESDQIVLMTDGGQVIRCPVNDIRIAGRNTQGVTLFRVNDDEHVVSIARLANTGDDEEIDDQENDQENGSSPP